MKKLFIYLMTIVLTLSSVNFLAVPASALDQDITDSNVLLSLAKSTFPEYKAKLEDTPVSIFSQQSKSHRPQILVQETRPIDKCTTLTYTEYTNGIVTVSAARFLVDKDLVVDSTTTFPDYKEYSATISVYVKEGFTFTATDVKYQIYPSDYDRVLSVGDYSTREEYIIDTFLREEETDSLFACAGYTFTGYVGPSWYKCDIVLQLQNNTPSLVVDIF